MVEVRIAPEMLLPQRPETLLLQRAEAWEEEGKPFQAIALYLRLMQYHRGSEEAQRARGRLFTLAQHMEASGRVHQALHLYERLAAR